MSLGFPTGAWLGRLSCAHSRLACPPCNLERPRWIRDEKYAAYNTDIRSVREGMSELEVDAVYRHNLCLLMFSDPLEADDLAVWIQRENIARARVQSDDPRYDGSDQRVLADSPVRLAGLWGEKDLFADAEHRALQEAALRWIIRY